MVDCSGDVPFLDESRLTLDDETWTSCVCEKGGAGPDLLWMLTPNGENIAQLFARKEVRFKEFGCFSWHVSASARWQESSLWKCQRLCLERKSSSKDCERNLNVHRVASLPVGALSIVSV